MLVRSCLWLSLVAVSLTAQTNSAQDLVRGAFDRAVPSPFVMNLQQAPRLRSFDISGPLRLNVNSPAQLGAIKNLPDSDRACAVPLTEMKTSKDRVFSIRKLPVQKWKADQMAMPPAVRVCKG